MSAGVAHVRVLLLDAVDRSIWSGRLAHQRAALARARATYGSELYDTAFQTGAVMTYDQTVEYTLRVLDDLIDQPNVR